MSDVTNEFLLNVLKQVQTDLVDLKDGQREIRQELIAIRGHVTAIQNDVSNLYSGQAKIELRLERVEKALELSSVPAH